MAKNWYFRQVSSKSLSPCIAVVEGAFDRLALLAAGLDAPDVIALVGTALQIDTLPLQVQSVVLALDGDESGRKAAQKLGSELQAAGLAVTLCAVPQDGQGKDWSERLRTVPDGEGTYPVIEAWVSGLATVEEPETREEPAVTASVGEMSGRQSAVFAP